MEILHTWTVHLFEKKKLRGIVMLCAMAVLVAYMIFYEKSILFTLITVVVVVIPTYQFYFPVTYKIGDSGVRVESVLAKKEYVWTSFTSYDLVQSHFFLHTNQRGTKKNRRGDVILRDATEIDKVRSILDERITHDIVV